jgi:hypothetical protein
MALYSKRYTGQKGQFLIKERKPLKLSSPDAEWLNIELVQGQTAEDLWKRFSHRP